VFVPRPASQYPTPVEAEILAVAWERGPVSVRDVHDVVGKSRDNAYSSVATIMRIMAKKGLLKVADARRPVKFAAAVERNVVGRNMTQDLINRVFGGSLVEMLKHALQGKKRSAAEIAEIKKLIKSLD
jgi:predicted transcriptional regulator